MHFYDRLDRFSENIALIDAETGVRVTYNELESLVRDRVRQLDGPRKLIFIEVKNDIHSLVIYLACLRSGHVVHLIESRNDPKTKPLIDIYKPNLIIGSDQAFHQNSLVSHDLHPDLCLLLSTSGSTGTPKFVKLSSKNVHSNAVSISEYLEIGETERAFSHLKSYYSYGLSVVNSHIASGAGLILTSRSITEPEFLDQLKRFEATSLAGVPYTFETLRRLNFDLSQFVRLRTLTQAGGKLEPHLVLDYAKRSKELGKRFVVMYGQTEAAPRMAYLPSQYLESNPESIGLAIPGGELYIVDANHQPVVEAGVQGELAYKGPNVMMGYALTGTDLGSDNTPTQLLTGDIAYKNIDGLFFIVGRSSRFVKIFGLRFNLDQIQSDLKSEFGELAVAGTDERIKIAVRQKTKAECLDFTRVVARKYNLPESCFAVTSYREIPVLSNGKYDYKAVLSGIDGVKATNWIYKIGAFVAEVLEINDKDWASISDVYKKILNLNEVELGASFDSLGADSLSYVCLAIELEEVLGASLPGEWRSMSIRSLEELYVQKNAASA